MEPTTYQLAINTRTLESYFETARFYIGNIEEVAMDIYGRMEGTPATKKLAMLRLDLIKVEGDSSIVIATLDCTLDEIVNNTKTIIKETFKALNLI